VTDKKKYPYWLAVEDAKTVRFADLAHMMAIAMHPSEAEGYAYAAARINLESELPQAVRDGLLRVRNPAGLGLHTFPHGDALQRAVLIPDTDLEPFLNERGIELRLTPRGSGPDYWTLENTAIALQEQEGWHDGTRAKFQDQLQAAAQSGTLAIRDPRTCLPINSSQAHTYWELVTPADVNAWLQKLDAPYRWRPSPLIEVGDGLTELATYQLADLEPILPLTNCGNQTFLGKAEACGELVEFWATEAGLWLYIPEDMKDDFKVTTGFERTELERKLIGGVQIYALRDGSPVLPLPFTAAQLRDLDGRTGGVFTERIVCGSDTEGAIDDLSRRNRKTAELARAVLFGVMPPKVRSQAEPQGYPKVLDKLPISGASMVTPVSQAGTVEAAPTKYAQVWSLKTSIARAPGYRWPLYQILKAAHIAGQPCPKARNVLDAWAVNPPRCAGYT
jgi:hypothetical protein